MLRRFFITFCIVVVIVIVFSSIVTQKRDKRRMLEIRQKNLAEKIAYFKKRNYELEKENSALINNDPIQIEREARETFGYIKPGETIYRKYKFSISEPENKEIKQSSILRKMDSFLFEGPFPWQVPLGIITIAAIFLLISYRYER